MDMKERDDFELLLNRKKLSQETIKSYLIFYDKIQEILMETGLVLNQMVVDAYLDVYPHLVARATLRNYLEFKQRKDLNITKITGRNERKEPIIIPSNEQEAIRMALYNHDERYGLIHDITLSCALRRQEVLNIKAEDIDISDGEKMFIIIKHGKGKKQRKVFVKDDIAVLILTYLQNNPMKLSSYLFESKERENHPIDKTMWNKAFTKACLNATGKRYHPHQLRGTKATEWYDKGVDLASIQKRLGHSSIATTMLYIKPDERKEMEKWSNEE